jgi:hypothetical protein
VAKALGGVVEADRIDYERRPGATTDGRRTGGRSLSGQLEFVLLWP